MYMSHKVEIQLTKDQEEFCKKQFEYSRWCYNKGLEIWNKKYQRYLNKEYSGSDCKKPTMRSVRDAMRFISKQDWRAEGLSNVYETALEDLGCAYNMFYKKVAKKPKFKSKKNIRCSFRIYRKNEWTIRIENNMMYIPTMNKKSKGFKLKESIRIKGTIKSVTIFKKSNKWFASYTIETDEVKKPSSGTFSCGIDVGIKTFAVVANEKEITSYNYPSKLRALYAKKKYLHRCLSRKVKGSKRYELARIKLQKCYLKITNLRNDFLHKLTRYLVDTHKLICIESLNVTNMLKNKRLVKSLYNTLFYRFKDFLRYKCNLYDVQLVEADRYFPSTQTCSSCNYVRSKPEKLGLGDRIHVCPKCGFTMDRDENAAINLRHYGLNY